MTAKDTFKRELVLRKYAISTIETYTGCLAVIIDRIGEKPSIDQIKDFLIAIKNRSYHKQMVGTIHRYFEFVLKQPLDLSDIPYPRHGNQLPEILSRQEIKRLIDVPKNLKHQAIIFLLYGCGLRVSEVLNLKIIDIDSQNMIIRIRQAKGNKDRQVMLDEKLLILLRQYVREQRPQEYLFNGQLGLQYTDRSINTFLKYYAKRAGINRRVYAHLLRHCFATHLLEQGTDMALIQRLLGHNSPKTTQIYARISTGLISQIKSPLSCL